MDATAIRELFPGTRRLLYFNAAAQSLMPRPVAEAMRATAEAQMERGILAFGDLMQGVAAAREAAARLVGAVPDEIAFTAHTTAGLSVVAEGLDWQAGDEVVLADLEYPANVYPWAAQRARGVRLRFVRSEAGRIEVQRYLDALGPRTRVLAVSQVQFGTGYRVELEPLGEACRARGILFVVDAIQSLGVVPLEARRAGIGALAVDGRKWLMGPAGCGFLFVAREWQQRLRPTQAGTASVREPQDLMQYLRRIDEQGQLDLGPMLREDARRFEGGFPNVVGITGLRAALELGEAIGRERIGERIARSVARFVERLEAAGFPVYGPRTPEERAGIVSFSVPGDAEQLFRRLNAKGCSLSVRDGRLRVSPHVYNTDDEIDRAIELLQRETGRS